MLGLIKRRNLATVIERRKVYCLCRRPGGSGATSGALELDSKEEDSKEKVER